MYNVCSLSTNMTRATQWITMDRAARIFLFLFFLMSKIIIIFSSVLLVFYCNFFIKGWVACGQDVQWMLVSYQHDTCDAENFTGTRSQKIQIVYSNAPNASNNFAYADVFTVWADLEDIGMRWSNRVYGPALLSPLPLFLSPLLSFLSLPPLLIS
jgi:hypothetical protein